MAANDKHCEPELVGTEAEIDRSSARAGALSAAAILVVVALWMVTSTGAPRPTAPEPDRPLVEQPAPAPEPAAWTAPELLVALSGSDLIVVEPTTGTTRAFPVSDLAVGLAAGEPATVFVHSRDGTVDLVDLGSGVGTRFADDVEWFSPSAAPGRIWLRRMSAPDELVETDASGRELNVVGRSDEPVVDPRLRSDEMGRLHLLIDGSELPLGPHEAVAATASTVFAQRCESDRCRVEQRPLATGAGWEPIVPTPRAVERLMASADGRWLLSLDQVTALYRTDRWGTALVHTGVTDAAFGPDSGTLYLFTVNADVTVIDLVADATRSLPIGDGAATARGWIAVAR